MPDVDVSWFSTFTGITLSDDEINRVTVLMDRARRTVDAQVDVPDDLEGDDLLDYSDAVAELAWYHWEAEKAGVMEIVSMPLLQLSLGGLFWTKDTKDASSGLAALKKIVSKWGVRGRARIVLEGELSYPD